MFLSTLATLNFSLALITGLLAAPLTFIPPCKTNGGKIAAAVLLNAISPTTVLFVASAYWGIDVTSVLREAAVAWHVSRTYSPVVVWCVWWPAWVASGVVVFGGRGKEKVKTT